MSTVPSFLPAQIGNLVSMVNANVATIARALSEKTGKEVLPRGVFRQGIVTGTTIEATYYHELIAFAVGDIPRDRLGRYHRNSLEKAIRLWGHCYARDPHVSSFQSRNERQEMYGGAVLSLSRVFQGAGKFHLITSFSGMPEHGDEALDLSVLIEQDLISLDLAEHICDISQNDFARNHLGLPSSF